MIANTKDEKSLLLYLESRAVDYGGAVDSSHMNAEDFQLARRWNDSGFIRFGRIYSKDVTGNLTNWVILSDEAWAEAHAERRARNARMQSAKTKFWTGFDEKEPA